MLGNVTRRNVFQPLARNIRAASSWVVPCWCITGISSRATNGKVTNRVARMIPGTANTMRMPCAASQGPNHPCNPNSKMNTMPEMTGDTENGRSINVISRLLPWNSNLVIAQAAATPKTRLSGTAIAAVSKVNSIAASASGSVIAAT